MHRQLTLCLLSLFLTFGRAADSAGGSITYHIENYAALQSGYTLSGTITTDGTLGTLASADITAWSFSVTGPTSYQSMSSTAGATDQIVGVTATATDLLAAPGSVTPFNLILASGAADGGALVYERYSANDVYQALPHSGAYSWNDVASAPPGLSLGGSTWVIATAATVPEPEALTLALVGSACLAVAQTKRRYRRRRES